MPLYEYECDACGHRFEVIQKFSDPPVETCQKCAGRVHKLLSSPAIQFKGSGWYITDYARAGKSDNKGKSESKSESGSSSTAGDSKSGESQSDSKADSKTESKTESKSEAKATTPSTS